MLVVLGRGSLPDPLPQIGICVGDLNTQFADLGDCSEIGQADFFNGKDLDVLLAQRTQQ